MTINSITLQAYTLGNQLILSMDYVNNSNKVKYELRLEDTTIFEGSDYKPSPLCKEGPLSKYSAAELLDILFLKPGDTDAEYFEDYTKEQLDFVTNPMTEYWRMDALFNLGLTQLDNGDYMTREELEELV